MDDGGEASRRPAVGGVICFNGLQVVMGFETLECLCSGQVQLAYLAGPCFGTFEIKPEPPFDCSSAAALESLRLTCYVQPGMYGMWP